MQFDELRFVCQQAAVRLFAEQPRPIPPTVVLPGPDRTQLVTLPDFPDDDAARHLVMSQLATDRVSGPRVPCWGFVAEAQVADREVVVVIYGARRHHPHLTAATIEGTELADFVDDEPLDATAMPFLHPLQQAVDKIEAVTDVFAELDTKRGPSLAP